jgi:hypothetical protein
MNWCHLAKADLELLSLRQYDQIRLKLELDFKQRRRTRHRHLLPQLIRPFIQLAPYMCRYQLYGDVIVGPRDNLKRRT